MGKRAPEDVASCSEVCKRPRIQGTSTACDKDSDKREIMEPAKPESEAISSAGATMLQCDGYSCEHFDGKIERTFCAHCYRRVWSLRCGVDREQGWLHPECILESAHQQELPVLALRLQTSFSSLLQMQLR